MAQVLTGLKRGGMFTRKCHKFWTMPKEYDKIKNRKILLGGIHMKTFIGTGQGNAEDAVKKATQGLTAPKAILFMTPYAMAKKAAMLIHEAYPDIPSIGTIGTKFVNGQIGEQNLSVLAFFDDAKISCGIINEISRYPVASVHSISKKLAEVSPGHEDTVCIEYCTGAEEKLITTFTSCLEKKKVSLMGGTSFGNPEGTDPVVAYNGRLYTDACVYAFVKNLTGKAKVYKENIYEKHSSRAHFATKVDVPRKALIELDGRPAADVYSREIGISKDKIIDNVLVNPIGRAVGDQVFISSMKELEANGTILNFKRINKNDCIYFLSLGDYKEIERKTREKIKNDMKKVSLIVSVDCATVFFCTTKMDISRLMSGTWRL